MTTTKRVFSEKFIMDEFSFLQLPDALRYYVLRQLWTQGCIQEVLKLSILFNKDIQHFFATYPNSNRGGVIGELLQETNPRLRQVSFPFLSYMVLTGPDRPWNWQWLSGNPSMTWEIVQANPDKPWNWEVLSRNPSISWKFIQANLDNPWDWIDLSRKKDLKL